MDDPIPTMADFVEMDAGLNPPQGPLEIVERDFNDAEYFQVLACPQLEDKELEYGVAIVKTRRTYLASTTDMELININTTQSDASGSVVSHLTDANGTKELLACTQPVALLTKFKKSDEFNSDNKSSPAQPSSEAANLMRNKSSKKKSGQSTSSSIICGETGSGDLKKVSISGSAPEVHRLEVEDKEHEDSVVITKTTRTHQTSRTDIELINKNTAQTDDSGSVVLVSDPADVNGTQELPACTRAAAVLTKLKESEVSDELNSNNKRSLPLTSSDAAYLKDRLRNKSSKKKSGQSTSSSTTVGKTGSGNSKKASISGSCLEVDGQQNHKCNFCEKVFLSSAHLENHLRVHTREKPFKCSSCEKTFSELNNLCRHKKIHTGEKPFKCSFCVKVFAQKSNLKEHENIHTGERPFICSFCVKAFAHRSNLKKHKKMHTGERPFKCSFCVKAFAHGSNLKVHEKMHTGERPFKCIFCAKVFIQKSHLKKHEISHTGQRKPFKCCYCTKGFSTLCNVRKHERTHTGERP